MVAHLQEVSMSSFLASAAGTCHTWQLPQETLSFITPQNTERLHCICSSQKIIENIEK